MNGNVDIFISFCSSDVPAMILDEVAGCAERHGKHIYCFDLDESNLAEDIKGNLETKILESNAVFVITTPNAVKSMWIDFEIDCAIKHNKKIIAICDDNFPDGKFPRKLRGKVALKYKAVEGLRQRLKKFLEDMGYTAYIPGGGFGGGMIEFCTEVPKALCYVGEKPMLFHVIDALEASPFRKVVVINHETHAHEFIEYRLKMEYLSQNIVPDECRDNGRYTGKIECVKTKQQFWPAALKEIGPKETFLVNMCDVILSFNKRSQTRKLESLKEHWVLAVDKHKRHRGLWDPHFLGTLITCEYLRLAAGVITDCRDDVGEICDVEENPEVKVKVDFKMNTGVAILEPDILEYVEDNDESLLGGAIKRLCDEQKVAGKDQPRKRRFVEYKWPHWNHVMHLIDLKTLHDRRLKMLRNGQDAEGITQ